MKEIFKQKIFFFSFLILILAEFFSFYGFFWPIINKVCFLLIVLAVIFLSWKNLAYGLYFSLAELIIGSKGYLFFWQQGHHAISVRLGIFLAVMGVWAFKKVLSLFRGQPLEIKFFSRRIFPYYALLLIFVFWGVLSGWLHHNSLKNIFFDVNAWFYFFLAFPLSEAISKENILSFLAVALAALLDLLIKTFLLFFLFSHNFVAILPFVYKWVRVTGVGEITNMQVGFYRIFFQSHIYAVFAFLIIFPYLSKKIVQDKEPLKKVWRELALAIFTAAVIAISLSRSFWVGLGAAFLTYETFIFLSSSSRWQGLKIAFGNFLLLLAIFASGLYSAAFLAKVPVPHIWQGRQAGYIFNALDKRTKDFFHDRATGSRWRLLPPLSRAVERHWLVGQGFGSTVTYHTEDPRALQTHPNGLYTTYAFEWGYLGIWLKLGLLGLLAYLLFLKKIIEEGWDVIKEKAFSPEINCYLQGALLSLVALIVVHFFTPYLNHPLGIGYLLFLDAIFSCLFRCLLVKKMVK